MKDIVADLNLYLFFGLMDRTNNNWI